MRILVLSAVFPPEPVISAQTSAQIARELIRKGHSVTVVTSFPSRPAGELYPGFRRRLYQRQNTPEGYEIIRCFSFLSAQSRLVSRFLENISIGCTASLAILFLQRAEIIYSNMWPIFASGMIGIAAWLRRIPLVVSIQDVYPKSLVYQQRLGENSLLVRLFEHIDGAIARASKAVIVLSERYARLYQESRKVPAEKVFVVPNWTKHNPQLRYDNAVGIRRKFRIPDDAFLLVYGGNIGYAAGVESLIEAFRYIPSEDNIYLLIAGSGSKLSECQLLASEISGKKIRFYSPWPADETNMVYAMADVLVLPTRGSQTYASVPSKMIAYMLAERPIIAMSMPETDLTDFVHQSDSGWIVEPDNPEKLASKILEVMKMDRAVRSSFGINARVFALQHLTADKCLPKIIHIIETGALSEARTTP